MKLKYFTLPCLCGLLFSLSGAAMVSHAAAFNPVPVSGPVTTIGENSITINNQSATGYQGDIIIAIVPGQTRIIDVTTGFPLAVDQVVIHEGSPVYAYVGPAMTMSIPPQTNAQMILANIPQDYKVPAYVQIESFTADGRLTTTAGEVFTIPDSAILLPYLTKNMVSKEDLTAGKMVLIWSDNNQSASKVVIFPGAGTNITTGWQQQDNQWYYYHQDGTTHRGWLQDQGSWYYLNPDTGIMQTGFLTLEGKTYYLQGDGRMLTTAKTFTPDENGALH